MLKQLIYILTFLQKNGRSMPDLFCIMNSFMSLVWGFTIQIFEGLNHFGLTMENIKEKNSRDIWENFLLIGFGRAQPAALSILVRNEATGDISAENAQLFS